MATHLRRSPWRRQSIVFICFSISFFLYSYVFCFTFRCLLRFLNFWGSSGLERSSSSRAVVTQLDHTAFSFFKPVRTLSQLARRIHLAQMQPNHLPRLADRLFCQNRRRNVYPVHSGVKPGQYLSNQGRSASPLTLPHHTIFLCDSVSWDPA